MIKRSVFILAFFSLSLLRAQNGPDIDSLIRVMTIEEKAGQMTQIDLGVIAKGDICALKQPQSIDDKKLKSAIQTYHIGSVLNVGCGSGTIALDRWHDILRQLHQYNSDYSRLKIPVIYGIDAIHGVNYTKGATLFPQQIGQAATWNPQLVKQVYQITAYETRASGLPWNFSPVLDLGRQPLWSRFFETFGEDVVLAKSMSQVAVQGLQGDGLNSPFSVAACMKHFLGYSMSLSGKDRTPVWMSDRELRAYFLPTFQTAIQQGAATVMINSGEINGTPVHINHDILTKLLRDELHFKGVAVTDWEDVYKLVNVHHVAATKKEAVKLCILAGIDMSMTPNDFEFTTLLVELIKEGSIPMSRIDSSVRRILQLKKDLGMFKPFTISKSQYPDFGSKKHAEVSYQTATESITLLKNTKSVLPITKRSETILVCGPAANSMNLLNGAWTHTWQGTDSTYQTPDKLTIVEAFKKHTKNKILYAQGSTLEALYDVDNVLRKAQESDKIVVCLGEMPSTEIPGNIKDLDLPAAQVELVKKLKATGKPVIVVCTFNRPRIIHEVVAIADAVVYAYLPGDEGGRAIADIITGEVNPSGKLPFTYPAASNDIVHYDRKHSEDLDTDFSTNAYKPEFDFGFGLSYTTFEYSNLQVSKDTFGSNDVLMVSVDVENTGKKDGKEVVQLYYQDKFASITPSVRQLCAFDKISLKKGEKKTVRFAVKAEDFSFINKHLQRVTERGDFELYVQQLKHHVYYQ